MPDMTTKVSVFMLRDLNRRPAAILAVVRRLGVAEIRTRNGEVFALVRVPEKTRRRDSSPWAGFRALWKEQRDAGLVPPQEREMERLNRIIAGEERRRTSMPIFWSAR